jgi:alpha-galactosidase
MLRRALALGLLPAAALAYDNGAPHSRLPPLGWSSWVALDGSQCGHSFDYCSLASVKWAADAYHSSGLYDAGYRHFHLDDCWAGTVNKTGQNQGRNATGYLEADAHLFPGGMKAAVDYVHSKNLTFGLYTCAGNFTCIGKRPGSGGPYDPDTGITAHVNYERDAATFAEWGV